MADRQKGDKTMDKIDHEELVGILDELRDKQHSVSEATGALRSRIKSILDDKGWNNAALAQIRAINNKSETARADFLRTFVPMFEAMLEHEWRDEMNDMLSDLDKDQKKEPEKE